MYFMSALLSLFLWSILNDFEHSKISLFIVHSGLATKDVFVESKLSLDRGCLVHYCIADIAGRNAIISTKRFIVQAVYFLSSTGRTSE